MNARSMRLNILRSFRDCGLDPVFKGGSAIQLLLPESLQRLSVDIDLAMEGTETEISSVLDAVNSKFGKGMNPHQKSTSDLPSSFLQYKVLTPSILSDSSFIIGLDFLLHEPAYKIQNTKIKTFSYDSEVSVRVPTIEALLEDKLTKGDKLTNSFFRRALVANYADTPWIP